MVRLTPKAFVVHDAELAHQVLAGTNDSNMVDTAVAAGRRYRQGLLDELDSWMTVRRDVWHGFAERLTTLHLSRFLHTVAGELSGQAGRQLDIVQATRRISGNAVTDFCFGGAGASDPAELNDVAEAGNAVFETAFSLQENNENRLSWIPSRLLRRTLTTGERLRQVVRDQVVGRRTDLEPREDAGGSASRDPQDLLDALLIGSDGPRDDQRVISPLQITMIASHGVPGVAMAWLALRLAEHPDAADRIACEVGSDTLTGERVLAGLPYTEAFVKEVVRLHPPQWLLTRTTLRPVELGGYRIPSGAEVLICPYLLHRDPRWWADPQGFWPERWLEGERPYGRHAYLAFGGGPRFCPGSRLGTVQLTAMAALLARDYTLDLPALADVPVDTAALLVPTNLHGSWTPKARE